MLKVGEMFANHFKGGQMARTCGPPAVLATSTRTEQKWRGSRSRNLMLRWTRSQVAFKFHEHCSIIQAMPESMSKSYAKATKENKPPKHYSFVFDLSTDRRKDMSETLLPGLQLD